MLLIVIVHLGWTNSLVQPGCTKSNLPSLQTDADDGGRIDRGH